MVEPSESSFRVPRGTPLPPPPPGVRYVRVPRWGVVVADDVLRLRVARFFHWPMIVLGLAILPLIIIENMQQPTGWLKIAVEIGFAIIWLAFVLEFAIRVSIAEARVEYMRRNWLDIVIIALPALRAFRIGASVARTSRVFKLRGVGMKCARYLFTIIIGLEATDRLMRRFGIRKTPVELKDPQRMTRYELMSHVSNLRKLNLAWAAWYEAHREHLAKGEAPVHLPPLQRVAGAPSEDEGGASAKQTPAYLSADRGENAEENEAAEAAADAQAEPGVAGPPARSDGSIRSDDDRPTHGAAVTDPAASA